MAKHNYTIAGDYSSPALYEMENEKTEEDVSENTAAEYLLIMRQIIDDRIEKRIKDGQDIAKVYTAEITDKTIISCVLGNVTVGDNTYDITTDKLAAITVRYNDDDYTDISNDSVQILSADDKWIKVCTYDGVNFYVLHRI